jgi:NADH dehydrogenase (ubiquinone) 1 alpha subcomplex subunit 4
MWFRLSLCEYYGPQSREHTLRQLSSYAIIGCVVVGCPWYLSRLARGSSGTFTSSARADEPLPDRPFIVIWTKDNPTPWNDIKQDENTKLINVNNKLERECVPFPASSYSVLTRFFRQLVPLEALDDVGYTLAYDVFLEYLVPSLVNISSQPYTILAPQAAHHTSMDCNTHSFPILSLRSTSADFLAELDGDERGFANVRSIVRAETPFRHFRRRLFLLIDLIHSITLYISADLHHT